jgi:hypothetical protein
MHPIEGKPLPNPDGFWRRETEHHENVLIDTAQIPAFLRAQDVQANVGTSFGSETNPPGLRVVTGPKAPCDRTVELGAQGISAREADKMEQQRAAARGA